jgi:hypothetical protein
MCCKRLCAVTRHLHERDASDSYKSALIVCKVITAQVADQLTPTGSGRICGTPFRSSQGHSQRLAELGRAHFLIIILREHECTS